MTVKVNRNIPCESHAENFNFRDISKTKNTGSPVFMERGPARAYVILGHIKREIFS